MSEVSEFPKLLWLADGREITVKSQAEQDAKVAEGAKLYAPGTPVPDVPMTTSEPDEEIVYDSGEDDDGDKPKKRGRK